MTKLREPIRPGEILREFMDEHGVSAAKLAREIDVNHTRVVNILNGRRSITADTAIRLGRFFGTSADLWIGLQAEYDLRAARRLLSTARLARVRISPKAPLVAA